MHAVVDSVFLCGRVGTISLQCTKLKFFRRMNAISTSGSSIWSRGGPRHFFRDFADVAKWSQASEASQYWPGSRARLRALEAIAFLTIKYAFSHFSWYFFFKFLMYICIGTLLNIYFNMRDSGDFDKCNFWSLYLRKSRVLVVPLV